MDEIKERSINGDTWESKRGEMEGEVDGEGWEMGLPLL